jgi:type IX secretion system PorP/SprF family membrane protein
MMKSSYISLFILLNTLISFGQQIPVLSGFNTQDFIFNPAVTGNQPYLIAGLTHRSQWTGFEYAPSTQLLSIHSSIDNRNSSFGGVFYNDKNGVVGNFSSSVSYSYKVEIREATLSFGLSGSFAQYSLLSERVLLHDNNDQLVSGSGKMNAKAFNTSSGLYLQHPKYYVGVSGLNLLPTDYNFSNGASILPAKHFVVHYGYNFFVGTTDILTLSTKQTFISNLPTWTEVDLLYDLNQKVLLGIGYRHQDAIKLMLGGNFWKDFIGLYSYDIGINSLRSVNGGSHEITLAYHFHYNPTFSRDKKRYNTNFKGKKFSLKRSKMKKTKEGEENSSEENEEGDAE